MNILLASSEVHPYSKTGGLADMVGALAKYLALSGHSVTLVTPLYGAMREKLPGLRLDRTQPILPLGPRWIPARFWRLDPVKRLTIYFVDCPEFYGRPALYQEHGADYPDNAERFVYFSKCVAYLARHLRSKPDIVHVHDWQTGLVPLLIRHERLTGEWPDPPRICCTIHNLAYQGVFPPSAFELTNLPYAYFNPKGVEYYGSLNCLKAGIVYADLITTVSPRYAREIMTPEFGCGLDGVLRDRKDSLIGILNGVDYDEWNTTNNPHLPAPFGPGTPSGKEAVKRHLQRELGLPEDPAIPLFGSVTRLVEQKGIDIQVAALEEMLGSGMQFVVLGSGQPYFEEACQELAVRHPEQVAARIGYDHALSHRIEGASDFFLMPSQFEPCGLNQLYSLRYGAVPIVRAVGGLDDSIIDATQDPERADGIKFHDYSARALAKAIRKALVLYGEKELLEHYRWNGMTADFSWDNTAGRYSKAFEALLE